MVKHISKQAIYEAFKRIRPQCKTDDEAFEIMTVNLKISKSTARKYGKFGADNAPGIKLDYLQQAQNNCSQFSTRVENSDVKAFTETLSNDIDGDNPLELIPDTQSDIMSGKLDTIIERLGNLESKVNAPFVHTSENQIKISLSQEITTEFFLSDLHWHPEHSEGHDPAVWAVIKQALKLFQPDIVYFGGDILDCYAPARYLGTPRLKTPEAYDGEIIFGKQCLQSVRTLCPNARFIWLTGNHEERVRKSIFNNASWLLSRLRSVESDLGLSEFDCALVEDGHKIGKLAHYHGDKIPGAGRVNVAKTKFERLIGNFIFGHHHRFSKWMPKNTDGGYYGAFGNATAQWLAPDYAPHNDWQQGFSVIEYAKSGLFHVDQVLIHKPSIWSAKAESVYGGQHIKVNLG